MKIQETTLTRKSTSKPTNTKASVSNSTSKICFSSEMYQQENLLSGYEKEINVLCTEIETIGGKLEKEPTITNFKQFRDILSRLAKRISTEAYRLEKYGGTPQNPRYYEIITTINMEADNLYKLIIKEQKNNMEITAKVIGIKGLVVDLIT